MPYLIVLVILWFLAGALIGLVSGYSPVVAGLVSLVIGLVWLAGLTRDERRRRLFYEGPLEHEEDTDLLLGCLWAAPITVILMALISLIALAVLRL